MGISVFVYIWVSLVLFGILSFLIIYFVEKNVPDTHAFKKWWRKHIMDIHPDER